MKRVRQFPTATGQRGTVLFVSLMLLVVLTLIGVTAARMQSVEEVIARNEDNHQLALQSGEAALRLGEATMAAGLLTDANFEANAGGTYVLMTELAGAGSIADSANWAGGSILYAGPGMAAVPLAAQPQYVLEALPPVMIPGDPPCTAMYGGSAVCTVTRVSAQATGGDGTSSITIQSIFH